jgi:mycothiol synthase
MAWPEGIEARPIVLDDAIALAELRAATEKVDDEGEHEDADDVLEWLRHPWFDGPRGSLGLWSGDRMAGWAVIWSGPVPRDADQINFVGGVATSGARRPAA